VTVVSLRSTRLEDGIEARSRAGGDIWSGVAVISTTVAKRAFPDAARIG